jgi:gamma-glutamyltranspeptidase / glutathione hydrolase
MPRTFLPILGLIFVISACSRDERTSGDMAVSCASPEAARAAMEILEQGGNAMDAAVAAAMALGVSEPAGSGLGGQTVILLQKPGEIPLVIDGSSTAPMRTPPGIFSKQQLRGVRATTVPTTVKTLKYALTTYGSGMLGWKQVLQPAIQIANEGYQLRSFGRQALLESSGTFLENALNRGGVAADVFLGDSGFVPNLGAIIKQPMLAKTLERLADEGAESFYTGKIAHEIIDHVQSQGGWLTIDDMYAVKGPIERPTIYTKYRDLVVHSVPPPYGGWVVIMTLNALEHMLINPADASAEQYFIAMARALRLGHRSRYKRPIKNLNNYFVEVASKINKQHAEMLLRSEFNARSGETTHFSIVDKTGMVVSVSQSVNYYFGSKVMHPTLGFFYNDYMHEFVLNDPKHPYALRAGAKPYSSMSPTIVTENGIAALALGSPGSARIISAIVQVISYWKDLGYDLEKAVSTPRIHVRYDSSLYVEQGFRIKTQLDSLREMGFFYKDAPGLNDKYALSPFFGGIHAVARVPDGWVGAADPRRDGRVLLGIVD